jgi:hypothetical protein
MLSEQPSFRRQAQKNLPDGFEMDRAALALLGPGVDVAQAALEWVLVEDRVRAGDVVDARDDIARLLDRPGRGEAQLPVPFGREVAVALGILPHVLEGCVDRGARRAQFRLALRDLGLDDVVLAQGLAGAARDLVARQLDKGVAGGAASRTRTKRVRSLQSFEGQEPRQSDEATAPQFPGLRGADNGPSQILAPFLDTYRTMCLAPQPRLLEQVRDLPIAA